MRIPFVHPLTTLAVTLAALTPFAMLEAQSPPSLQEQLEAQYPLTDIIAVGGCKAGNPETALVTGRAGIAVVPAAGFAPKCDSRYEGNGKLKPPGELCTGSRTSTAANAAANVAGRVFGRPLPPRVTDAPSRHDLVTLNKGDRVYPLKITVQKDALLIAVGTCLQDASGTTSFYKGEVAFPLSQELLTAAHVTQVEDRIAELFTQDKAEQASAPIPPAPAQTAEIPAPAAPVVDIGQSVEQVEAALGPPQLKLNSGRIYIYRDIKIKITFADGKVASLESL